MIAELLTAGNILARGRLKHQYPHSWRSKKPVIFRNTPQWFIAMDKSLPQTPNASLRDLALKAIKETRQRIRSIQRDISSLTDHSTYLSSKVTFLLDATLGLINL